MRVIINTLLGGAFSMLLHPQITVGQVKELIAVVQDIPIQQQSLVFRGRVLPDTETLAQADVQDGDNLTLVLAVSSAVTASHMSTDGMATYLDGQLESEMLRLLDLDEEAYERLLASLADETSQLFLYRDADGLSLYQVLSSSSADSRAGSPHTPDVGDWRRSSFLLSKRLDRLQENTRHRLRMAELRMKMNGPTKRKRRHLPTHPASPTYPIVSLTNIPSTLQHQQPAATAHSLDMRHAVPSTASTRSLAQEEQGFPLASEARPSTMPASGRLSPFALFPTHRTTPRSLQFTALETNKEEDEEDEKGGAEEQEVDMDEQQSSHPLDKGRRKEADSGEQQTKREQQQDEPECRQQEDNPVGRAMQQRVIGNSVADKSLDAMASTGRPTSSSMSLGHRAPSRRPQSPDIPPQQRVVSRNWVDSLLVPSRSLTPSPLPYSEEAFAFISRPTTTSLLTANAFVSEVGTAAANAQLLQQNPYYIHKDIEEREPRQTATLAPPNDHARATACASLRNNSTMAQSAVQKPPATKLTVEASRSLHLSMGLPPTPSDSRGKTTPPAVDSFAASTDISATTMTPRSGGRAQGTKGPRSMAELVSLHQQHKHPQPVSLRDATTHGVPLPPPSTPTSHAAPPLRQRRYASATRRLPSMSLVADDTPRQNDTHIHHQPLSSLRVLPDIPSAHQRRMVEAEDAGALQLTSGIVSSKTHARPQVNSITTNHDVMPTTKQRLSDHVYHDVLPAVNATHMRNASRQGLYWQRRFSAAAPDVLPDTMNQQTGNSLEPQRSPRVSNDLHENLTKRKAGPRCQRCNAKLKFAYTCRCEGQFCAKCRYSDRHNCTYDYQKQAKQQLKGSLTQCISPRVPGI
eukprot:m.180551 g.180551  ORF g.180551 m.180551 type:complete len:861 (-) comp16616_c0_seq3:31-2613(-)